MSLNRLIRSAGEVKSDPLFDKVKLLLHMDGEDGATVFTDVKGSPITPYNAITKTDVKHSGKSSAYFNHANAGLVIVNPAVQAIGTQAFSIEATFWPRYLPIGMLVSCASPTRGGYEWSFYYQNGYLKFYVGRRNFNHVAIGVPYNLETGKKYRVSVERTDTNDWYIYINGQPYVPAVTDINARIWIPNIDLSVNTPLNVGCAWIGQTPIYGNLDEVRITVGGARGYGLPMVDNGLPFPDF